MSKILITGGGGFQGSHLAESLVAKGHKVSVLNIHSPSALKNLSAVSDKINLIWGSVTDKEMVEESVRGQDVVFHMAAHVNVDESLEDPGIFFHVNVLGTHNVLEAVRKYGARLIFVSSREIYGDGRNLKEGEKFSESSEISPASPYAASKAAADRMCYSYFSSFGTDITIVRPFNVFGERQKGGKFGALIPILTEHALRGENLEIFGDGSTPRDYTHISDIIQAYNLVLLNSEALKGCAINFASGVDTKVKDIAEYIAKKFGVGVVYTNPRPGEVSRSPADVSFAKSLGYSPKISIWEGIDRYIEWAKNNV